MVSSSPGTSQVSPADGHADPVRTQRYDAEQVRMGTGNGLTQLLADRSGPKHVHRHGRSRCQQHNEDVSERWGSEDLDAPVLLGALCDPREVHDAGRSFEGFAGAAVEGFALACWLDAEHLGRCALDDEGVGYSCGHHDEIARANFVFVVVDAVLNLAVEHPDGLRDRVGVDRGPLALDHVNLDQVDVLVGIAELPGEDTATEEPPLLALTGASNHRRQGCLFSHVALRITHGTVVP